MKSIEMLNVAVRSRVPRYIYAKVKQRRIVSALEAGFDPLAARLPFGRLLDERIVEYPWAVARLSGFRGRLLDAGSVLNFDYLIPRFRKPDVELVISTLAPEKHAFWEDGVSYVYEDMRDSCLRDDFFDSIVCLSVLEHVGMDNTQLYTADATKKESEGSSYLSFLAELRRVLKPGGRLLLSMPFGVARNYGWLQTFDGAMVDRLLAAFQPSRVSETYFRYLAEGWIETDRAGASGAGYVDCHDASIAREALRSVAAESVVLLDLTK